MLALIRVILMDLGNNAFLRQRLGSVQGGECSPEQRDLEQTPIWGPSTPASLTQSPFIHNVSTLAGACRLVGR